MKKTELYTKVDRESLGRNLSELINAKSPNPFRTVPKEGQGEREVACLYESKMKQLGMDTNLIEIQEGRFNVYGILKGIGDGPTLMLAGHLDTVTADHESQYVAHIENDRVYGRGACDMKAALASSLEAVRVIQESGITLKGNLILCGVADEEDLLIGSQYVGKNGPKADFCIIGEPTEMTVASANRGQLNLFIKVIGKSVHSSVPEEGVNAIVKMADVVKRLQDYHLELRNRPPHPLCGTGSCSPGVIKGGTIASAVPGFCELEVDRRLLPGETVEDAYREIKEILDDMAAKDSEFRYELSEPSLNIPSNEISQDHPVVSSLINNYMDVFGRETKVCGLPFGTDAPNMGCPTVVCGPGSIKKAHSADEYVEIDQLEKGAKMYIGTIIDLIG